MSEEKQLRREPLGKKLRTFILERDGYSCRYCGTVGTAKEMNVDHVLAVVRGGGNSYANLVTSCWRCNIQKGAHGAGWLIEQAPEDIRAWWRDFIANPPQGPEPKNKKPTRQRLPKGAPTEVGLRCNLQPLRKKLGVTLRELSEQTGLAISTLHALDANTWKGFQVKTVNALCKYFSCDMDTMFSYIEDDGTVRTQKAKRPVRSYS